MKEKIGQGREWGLLLEEVVRETRDYLRGNAAVSLYRGILETVERPMIEIVLERTAGNKKRAARILGINRNTLHARISKLGIDTSRFKD